METDERQVTQISVEDLTVKLKQHQFFRVRYFAKKHNDYIVRMGIVDDKMRLWEDSKEEICFTYFDLQQNGYRWGTSDEDKLDFARFHSLSCMQEWLDKNKQAFAFFVDNVSENMIQEDNQ
jgi:hypothetical protein